MPRLRLLTGESSGNLVDSRTETWFTKSMTKNETPKVENYSLQTRTGQHIRTATKVIFSDGTEVAFTERMSKREAIRQAEAHR